jgi:nitrous oxidase accessory protein NosD
MKSKKFLAALLAAVMVLAMMPAMAAAATTIKVGPGETYVTIQAAINAASPGDTIEVHPGTYAESITINKELTVVSTEGAGVTVLDLGHTITTLVTIAADGVIFSGFRVQNAQSGIKIGTSNNIIRNNIIADISRWSVEINGTGNLLDQGWVHNSRTCQLVNRPIEPRFAGTLSQRRGCFMVDIPHFVSLSDGYRLLRQ